MCETEVGFKQWIRPRISFETISSYVVVGKCCAVGLEHEMFCAVTLGQDLEPSSTDLIIIYAVIYRPMQFCLATGVRRRSAGGNGLSICTWCVRTRAE